MAYHVTQLNSDGEQPPATHTVMTPTGHALDVMTGAEAEYYERSKAAYLDQTKFTENTDLVDLERLLGMELMIFRWQRWLFGGFQYDGDFVPEKQVTQDLKYYSDQITKIKESMGLTKKARDAAQAEGNFGAWLENLQRRAKEWGYHRETQLTKALSLVEELSALVGVFDRSDEEERHRAGVESEAQILDWVRNVMLPEYEAIDEHFKTRPDGQKYWIREL